LRLRRRVDRLGGLDARLPPRVDRPVVDVHAEPPGFTTAALGIRR
jgi:hypothetical protein